MDVDAFHDREIETPGVREGVQLEVNLAAKRPNMGWRTHQERMRTPRRWRHNARIPARRLCSAAECGAVPRVARVLRCRES